jgi:hypothetical protein
MSALSSKEPVQDSPPEFFKILDSFQEEINKAENLKYALSLLGNNLKRKMEQPCMVNQDPSKEPETITEHLWDKIWRLRYINNENELTINHLRDIIGT